MTRILVQRGSAGSSASNPTRSSLLPGSSSSSSSSAPPQPQVTATSQAGSAVKDEEIAEDVQEQVVNDCVNYNKATRIDHLSPESLHRDHNDDEAIDIEKVGIDDVGSGDLTAEIAAIQIRDDENDGSRGKSLQTDTGRSYPPPPPVPPPKLSSVHSVPRRIVSSSLNPPRTGSSRRAVAWPIVSTRTSPTGSRPSSPRSHCESEGYNSADEQSPCFGSSYNDAVRFVLFSFPFPLHSLFLFFGVFLPLNYSLENSCWHLFMHFENKIGFV